MKFFIALLIWLLLKASAYASNDFLTEALKNGDYEKAFQLAKILAEGGDPHAQMIMGLMYKEGPTIPKDYLKALDWLKQSAKQGQSYASFTLGKMYAKGEGVKEDQVKAYMWFHIAAEYNHYSARRKKADLENRLSAGQIDTAKQMADRWLSTHQTKP